MEVTTPMSQYGNYSMVDGSPHNYDLKDLYRR